MLNVKDVQLGTTTRKSFAKINEVMQMPNLIEVQKKSYQWFLDEGLEEVFRDIGSITDYTGNLVLDFIDYTMDEDPKYTIAQCKARDVTYAKPLKVRARLQNKETGDDGCRHFCNQRCRALHCVSVGAFPRRVLPHGP